MSYIKDTVRKHIREYDKTKTGEWHKALPPPPNTFTLDEIYIIGSAIISEIEGKLSDKMIDKKE